MTHSAETESSDGCPPGRRSSYTYEDLLACGHGGLFGADGARLPKPNMLMTDRITRISNIGGDYGKGEIIAELDINPDLWFFECHFEDDPVMPGCLGLDALWQMLGFFLGWQGLPGPGRALGVGEVKFAGEVKPEAKLLRYQIDVKKVIKRGVALAIADGLAELDGETVYTTAGLKVGLFPPSKE